MVKIGIPYNTFSLSFDNPLMLTASSSSTTLPTPVPLPLSRAPPDADASNSPHRMTP